MNHSDLLKNRNLSLTPHRIELLRILSGCSKAVSEKDIEVLMKGSCNRTTIYRNLNSLVNKKIVHRVLSGDAVKYKLIAAANDMESRIDHIHFDCNICNTTYCFEQFTIKDFELPQGFTKLENQFIIFGICKNCQHESK